MKSGLLFAPLAGALVSSCSTGCVQHGSPGPHPHSEPPLHAPAHGNRHSYGDGIELVFDSGLGLYVVSGRPHYYFQDGWYWRPHHSVLEISLSLGGPWRLYGERFRHPPPGLAEKYGYLYRLPRASRKSTVDDWWWPLRHDGPRW